MRMSRSHPLLHDWNSLSREDQRALARDIARDLHAKRFRPEHERALAAAMNFRVQTLHRVSEDSIAASIQASLPFLNRDDCYWILVAVHFGARASVLSEVYERMGVPHDETEVSPERFQEPLDCERVAAGFAGLEDSPDRPRLWFCLCVMRHACTEAWREGVEAAIAQLASEHVASGDAGEVGAGRPEAPAPGASADSGPEADAEGGGTEANTSLPQPPEFTTLDRLVIRGVVGSLHEIHGSLNELERNDLVVELTHLNEAREQSWFHLGFLDALQGKAIAAVQKGDNRERRAWYLSGFLHGSFRLRQDEGILTSFKELDAIDRERLLGRYSSGGALVSEIVVPAFLGSDNPSGALEWLRLYGGIPSGGLVPIVTHWSRRAGPNQSPQIVADILEATLAGVRAFRREDWPDQEAVRELRRLQAVAWRRLGRFEEARTLVESLLAEKPSGWQSAGLLCDRALVQLGVRSVTEVRVGHPDTRPALAEALDAVRPSLEEAAASGASAPIAHYLLGLGKFLRAPADDADYKAASAELSRALSAMSADPSGEWPGTTVRAHCEFLHAVSEMRLIDEVRAVPALQELMGSLEEAKDLPDDLLYDAVAIAAELSVPQVSHLVERLLARQPVRTLRELDLKKVAARNDSLRALAARFAIEQEEGLRSEERWRVWTALLGAALEAESGRDLATARRALDALERAAHSAGGEQQLLNLLADSRNWECAWDERDVLEVKVGLLRRLGRWAEAQNALERAAWRAIEEGEWDAAGWIGLYRDAGGAVATVEALERKLATAEATREAAKPATGAPETPVPVRILFVGGNETQERYEAELRADFLEANPGSRVDFLFPSWNSNSGKVVNEVKRRLADYSAMVLMRFVRTQLGRDLRRLASESGVPWIACMGHGRDSLLRAIEEAGRVGRETGRTRRNG